MKPKEIAIEKLIVISDVESVCDGETYCYDEDNEEEDTGWPGCCFHCLGEGYHSNSA
jgi:hypothetical protein